MSSRLTGRTRHRAGWFGRLVLQVEVAFLEPHPGVEGQHTQWLLTGRRWRDARCDDLVMEYRNRVILRGARVRP